jgi:hypothetical protein
MHPTQLADQLPLCGVQTFGGVPALVDPATSRHTTPRTLPLSPRDERPLTHVLS